MAIVSDPEQGDPVKSADQATNTVEVDFSTGSALYVLQFTYLDANVPNGFTEEQMQLLVFETGSDDWSLAIDDNSDGGAGNSFFAGSYADFLTGPGGGSLDSSDLSSYGVDATNNLAWAVLDHASFFSLGVLGSFSSTADVDGDTDVDGNDFLMIQRTDPALIPAWQAQYPAAAGALEASLQVPEPGSLRIVMGLFCGLIASYRRAGRR
jgi:hypothetical protein